MKIYRYLIMAVAVLSVSFNAIYAGIPNALQQKTQNGPPTFAENVAPIIWKHCVPCHRDGEVAPFTLISYEGVSRHAQSVRRAVISGYMPPWKPVTRYGSFADQRGLTNQEIFTITEWVDAGMPENSIGKTPPLPQFNNGSQLVLRIWF